MEKIIRSSIFMRKLLVLIIILIFTIIIGFIKIDIDIVNSFLLLLLGAIIGHHIEIKFGEKSKHNEK